MQTSNTVSVSFAKTEMKDLLIHQIATYMQRHWNNDEVIDLFLESQFNFIEPDKSRAEVVKELMKMHKYALQNEKVTLESNT